MHPYAAFMAAQQIDQLRLQAAERRLARTVRSKRPSPIAQSLRKLAQAWSTPLDERPSFLPKLTEYPNRG